MAGLKLKSLLGPVRLLLEALPGPVAIHDASGNLLLGTATAAGHTTPIHLGETLLGSVSGDAAAVVGDLINHLVAAESGRRALASEVLHLYREVHLIDQLSEQLTALLDPAAVGRSALGQAQRLISATGGSILLRDSADNSLRIVASHGEGAEPSAFVEAVLERGVAEIRDDFLCAPLRAKQHTVGAILLTNNSGRPYTAADLKLLNTIALQTAAAIENSTLAAEMVGAARDREQLAAIHRELETARTIQHSLVPRVFPPFPDRHDFDLHAQMTSARAVGGDFFDFFLIDQDHLGVVIGDVSGKGTPSALFMAVTRTHIKTNALRGISPSECLIEVNQSLVADKASSMFATCFYGILNTLTGKLEFCNAGHNPPYLVRASGAVEIMPEASGPPLGMFPFKNYSDGVAQLNSGDGLFLFTDGVSEADNCDLDDFSDARLVAVLGASAGLSARPLIERVYSEILAFTAEAPQSDDITMLSVRRTR